jgi:hypothetical protein
MFTKSADKSNTVNNGINIPGFEKARYNTNTALLRRRRIRLWRRLPRHKAAGSLRVAKNANSTEKVIGFYGNNRIAKAIS